MKLIYLTAKKYPGQTADHGFIKNMARSFTKLLGPDFLLVVVGENKEDLKGINFLETGFRGRGRTLRYFFGYLNLWGWRGGKI